MFSIVIDVGALFWGVLGFVGAESGVFAEAEREIEPGGADEVEQNGSPQVNTPKKSATMA